jgi:hypothetical protein
MKLKAAFRLSSTRKPTPFTVCMQLGELSRPLEDLEVKQCMLTGDEITNRNHLALLINGKGLVVDHCLFDGIKQTVVFWALGSIGHSMRNCLMYGSYAAATWTSGVANDLNFRGSDPLLLNLIDTKITEQQVQLELDQTKRNYLHVKEVTLGSDIGAVESDDFQKLLNRPATALPDALQQIVNQVESLVK